MTTSDHQHWAALIRQRSQGKAASPTGRQYRATYEIADWRQVILTHHLAHRRDAYRPR